MVDMGMLAAWMSVFLPLLTRSPVTPAASPECPADMSLVRGTHYEEVQHVCLTPQRDAKDTHCFKYEFGVTAEEGEQTLINVCMDTYEAPNIRGTAPFVMKSFDMADQWCASRGKRICTEQEWEYACEGREHRPLAYGWEVRRTSCNSGKGWRPFDTARLSAGGETAEQEVRRLWQGSPSGSYPECVSTFGIYDMMGNVEEWVASRKGRAFRGALMGGFWAKPWTGCRGTNDAHEPSFTFYETGFRCCRAPKS